MLWSSHSPERNRQIHMGPLPMPPTMHKRAGGGDTLPTQEASRTRRPPRPLAPTGFLFLGYRQTEGTDPTDAERCLDLVYERII
jgi:hypothetical protein